MVAILWRAGCIFKRRKGGGWREMKDVGCGHAAVTREKEVGKEGGGKRNGETVVGGRNVGVGRG